jgi:hypothetical protein
MTLPRRSGAHESPLRGLSSNRDVSPPGGAGRCTLAESQPKGVSDSKIHVGSKPGFGPIARTILVVWSFGTKGSIMISRPVGAGGCGDTPPLCSRLSVPDRRLAVSLGSASCEERASVHAVVFVLISTIAAIGIAFGTGRLIWPGWWGMDRERSPEDQRRSATLMVASGLGLVALIVFRELVV